jgi:hypothetical protein
MPKENSDQEENRSRRSGVQATTTGASTPNWRRPQSSLQQQVHERNISRAQNNQSSRQSLTFDHPRPQTHQTRSRGAALTEEEIRNQSSGFKFVPLQKSPDTTFELGNLSMAGTQAEAKKADIAKKAADKKESDQQEKARDDKATKDRKAEETRRQDKRGALNSVDLSSEEDGDTYTDQSYESCKHTMRDNLIIAMDG